MKRLFLIRIFSLAEAYYNFFAPLREIFCSKLVAHGSLLIFNLNSAYPNIHSPSLSFLM